MPDTFDYEGEGPPNIWQRPMVRKVWINGELIEDNSDGSDRDYSASDFAPMGLEEVSTGILVLSLLIAIFIVLGIPGFVIWYFN